MLYEPLPRDVVSIRLLELLPSAEFEDVVSCRLIVTPLVDSRRYTALSYRWDQDSKSDSILINDEENRIGRNLVSALRQIRTANFRASSPLSRFIWADQICINQENDEERTHQVQLMGTIYSGASTVVSWLGTNSDGKMTDAIMAIRLFQHAAKTIPNWLEDLKWMYGHPSLLEVDDSHDGITNRIWKSIDLLFSAPYWRRVWVLQEMALARSLWVMIGQHIFDFNDLNNSIQVLDQFSSEKSLGKGILPPQLLFYLRLPDKIPYAWATSINYFREIPGKIEHMNNADKLNAILNSLEYQATDPRDKIFALQGLLGNFITPDYGKNKAEVFSEFMSKYVADVGDLYLLRFAGATLHPYGTLESRLPSWVPDLQAISSAIPDAKFQAFPALAFQCDNGLDAVCPSRPRVLGGCYLRVNACICDVVVKAEPIYDNRSSDFVRLYQKLENIGTGAGNLTKVTYIQAILRAILTDGADDCEPSSFEKGSLSVQSLLLETLYFLERPFSSTTLPPIYDRLRSTIERLGIGPDKHIKRFLLEVFPGHTISDGWDDEEQAMRNIIKYDQANFLMPHLLRCSKYQHHLFRTADGHVGSSLDGIRAGDIISVIQGCPCPVLLRREGSRHIHLGTCFVVGLMHGEAFIRVNQGSLKMEKIDIE